MRKRIDPVKEFGALLSGVDKPARYLGGESLSANKPDAGYRVALCFPDLYEIGMANNAMRILYASLNALDGVACERYFPPEADFEALMRQRGLTAWGLESGMVLADADMLAFTVGYELLATNMLHVLHLAGLPLLSAERGEGHPIVIAGGPAITNPVPFSAFLDAVWIGEAEGSFFGLVGELAAMKAGGASRADMLKRLAAESAVWMPGKKAARAVYEDFPKRRYGHAFPVPVVKPVQDHGVVEVMRGCPNGCRFCHAGYFYRPQRLRDPGAIFEEVEAQVRVAGHREITLSSLSSGDYPGIFDLVRALNALYGPEGVSFQLPSLKVESFPLELVDELSGTRKSGLTFAVETPLEQWQMTINKTVGLDKIKAILAQAHEAGYRVAKFYFMVGLPLPDTGVEETAAIADFIAQVADASPLRVNVTLAAFVPKPHTPFQWAAQLSPEEAARRIFAVKDAFRGDKRVKISYHAPYLSWLEGLVSRGHEGVGELILRAYRAGARFDAWDDKFNRAAWESALASMPDFDPESAVGARNPEDPLPWDSVNLRVSKRFLLEEYERSKASVMSSVCADDCQRPCGSCGGGLDIVDKTIHSDIVKRAIESRGLTGKRFESRDPSKDSGRQSAEHRRVLLRYGKVGSAAYYPQHTLWGILAGAFERAGIALEYSQGFNPQPRLEISEPLSLGVQSQDEYAVAILAPGQSFDAVSALDRIGAFMPRGLMPLWLRELPSAEGRKFPSLSSLYAGTDFLLDFSKATPAEQPVNAAGFVLVARKAFAEHVQLSSGLIHEEATDLSRGIVSLYLPYGGKRELSLAGLYQEAFDLSLRDSGVSVTRQAQYAKLADGTKASYLKAYGLTESTSAQ